MTALLLHKSHTQASGHYVLAAKKDGSWVVRDDHISTTASSFSKIRVPPGFDLAFAAVFILLSRIPDPDLVRLQPHS